MIAKYGAYSHDDNSVEVTTSQRTEYSPRGGVFAVVKTVQLAGELRATTQAAMTIEIDKLIDEYAIHDQDFVLLDDNSNETPHRLDSDGSKNGVRVIQPPSFTKGIEVYSLTRTFAITLEATYVSDNAPELIQFVETISIQGNGGKDYAIVELLEGQPVIQTVRTATPVFVMQTGSAVGRTRYPNPSTPLSLGTAQGKRSKISKRTPDFIDGLFENYGIDWSSISCNCLRP